MGGERSVACLQLCFFHGFSCNVCWPSGWNVASVPPALSGLPSIGIYSDTSIATRSAGARWALWEWGLLHMSAALFFPW